MLSLFLISFCRSFDYPERREASGSSIGYFDSFERSRKNSKSDSFFGFKINPKIEGIKGIVENHFAPYKKVNFTAAILSLYDEIAVNLNGSIDGAVPYEEPKTTDLMKEVKTHLFSFGLYLVPFIVVGVIAIIVVIGRCIAQRFIPNRFFEDSPCKLVSYIIFGVAFALTIFTVIALPVGISQTSKAVHAIEKLPDTLVDVQEDIMPYYSATINKATSIIDLWKDEGKGAVKVVTGNLSTMGNEVLGVLTGIMSNLVGSSSSLYEIYNQGVAPDIDGLIQVLQQYPEVASKAALFENMGFLAKVESIIEQVQESISVASSLLDYSSVLNGFIGEGEEEEENEQEYYVKRVMRKVLDDKEHRFEPIKLNFNLKSIVKYYNIAKGFAITGVILILILLVCYLLTIIPYFPDFSYFIVKWSAAAPSLIILILIAVGGAFTVIGGVFAYYANAGIENTIDDTINIVFDTLPQRTLDIPDINLSAFTMGIVENKIDLPTFVFELLKIFKRLVSEKGETGLYKALDLYKFINISSIVESIGSSVTEIGEMFNLPGFVKEYVDRLFDNIFNEIPSTFLLLFEYLDPETGNQKTSIIHDAVSSASTIPDETKDAIFQCLDEIDNYTQTLGILYEETINEVKNNLKTVVTRIPETLLGIISYGFTKVGSVITKTSTKIDDVLNQVPVKVVQGTYNIVYNALFSDVIEGSSFISSASIIAIVCIPTMLVCFLFVISISRHRKDYEKSDSLGELLV